MFSGFHRQQTLSQHKTKKISTEAPDSFNYFLRAQKFHDQAEYDSSIIYFEKASLNYAHDENWAGYLNCYIQIAENLRIPAIKNPEVKRLQSQVFIMRNANRAFCLIQHNTHRINPVFSHILLPCRVSACVLDKLMDLTLCERLLRHTEMLSLFGTHLNKH